MAIAARKLRVRRRVQYDVITRDVIEFVQADNRGSAAKWMNTIQLDLAVTKNNENARYSRLTVPAK